MLHIFLLLLGAAACLMGLVTLFFPTAGNTGSEIPKIGAAVCGALVAFSAFKKLKE